MTFVFTFFIIIRRRAIIECALVSFVLFCGREIVIRAHKIVFRAREIIFRA